MKLSFTNMIQYALITVILFVSSQASALIPTGDGCWFEESSGTLTCDRIGGNSGGSGGGGTAGNGSAAAEEARISRCVLSGVTYQQNSCDNRGSKPSPTTTTQLTQLNGLTYAGAWNSQALAYAQTLYASKDPDHLYGTSGYSTQVSAYLQACGGLKDCSYEVAYFFGMTRGQLPDFPILGDVNGLANLIISLISKPNFEGSAAFATFDPYVVGNVCKIIITQRRRDRCGG